MLPKVDAVDKNGPDVESGERTLISPQASPAVIATNRRLTALLLVPALQHRSGSVSRERAYFRVATPIAICSRARTSGASVLARVAPTCRAVPRPFRSTTRGRRSVTRRPPSARSPGVDPARVAPRAASMYRSPNCPSCAHGLQHRDDRLQPQLVHQGEQVASGPARPGISSCVQIEAWFGDGSLALFFMAVPFWESTPRFPRGRVEPPPSSFSSQRDDASSPA